MWSRRHKLLGWTIYIYYSCSALIPSQLEDFSAGFPPNACWDQAGDGDPGTGPTGLGTSSWFTDGFGNIGTTGAVKINLLLQEKMNGY